VASALNQIIRFDPLGDHMTRIFGFLAVVALAAVSGAAIGQSSVAYGRITAVGIVPVSSSGAQVGGAVVGGSLGLISGSGQSRSNRALRGLGGAVVGQQAGRLATQTQAFQYTILLDGRSTVTVMSDEAGLRVGDCVAVERGTFNNLRLVDDARCQPGTAPTPAAVAEANACVSAKQQLLDADTDEAFDRAERRVRLLCAD
jgi:outer membrane lipoprotein SlyB